MSLPDELRSTLHDQLGVQVHGASGVGGGCIANASRLDTSDGPLFLKWGRGDVARSFPVEAAGLRALREAESPLFVPEVHAVSDEADGAPGFLVLDWIETGDKRQGFWEPFGEGLAALHRHTGDAYGFDHDNVIGRLPQDNTWASRWPAFFRSHRLEPQVKRARDSGRWQRSWDDALASLYDRLPDLLPAEPPASVVHGDLWSGNFMVAEDGRAALVDPAVYYGHREVDLAMTELFGGFDAAFYDAYRSAWPLEPGYDERREVYNLYHLINHLNHFGGSYAGSVERVLKRFG